MILNLFGWTLDIQIATFEGWLLYIHGCKNYFNLDYLKKKKKYISPVWPKFMEYEELFQRRIHYSQFLFQKNRNYPPVTIWCFKVLNSNRLSWRLECFWFRNKPVCSALFNNGLTLIPGPNWYETGTNQWGLNVPDILIGRQVPWWLVSVFTVTPSFGGIKEGTGEMVAKTFLAYF